MNVLKGMRLDLSSLPDRQKRGLLKMIARVSEASYRRGLQHGAVILERGRFRKDPGVWRYDRSLDQSPYGESGGRLFTAAERLDMEYGGSMREAGLSLSDNA